MTIIIFVNFCMSIAVNEIRPFWMPGLNEVVGKQSFSLAEWVIKQEYYIYLPITPDKFILDLQTKDSINNMLCSFACDCNRMASAAFETMYSIEKNQKVPKSTAWLMIKSYYAAFFAGHTIIRMLGTSCSQVNKYPADKIYEIAKLYKNDSGLINVPSSYYSCIYNKDSKQLSFNNIKSKGGVHESFWKVFCDHIKQLGKQILASPVILRESQDVFKKLDELCQILSYEGHNGGNWLSAIRNKVNYRHELGAWFPYHKIGQQNVEDVYRKSSLWLDDPMDINLVIQPGKPMTLFVSACNFIVALCRVLVLDMSDRCSKGKSYLKDGSLKLLNQCT